MDEVESMLCGVPSVDCCGVDVAGLSGPHSTRGLWRVRVEGSDGAMPAVRFDGHGIAPGYRSEAELMYIEPLTALLPLSSPVSSARCCLANRRAGARAASVSAGATGALLCLFLSSFCLLPRGDGD